MKEISKTTRITLMAIACIALITFGLGLMAIHTYFTTCHFELDCSDSNETCSTEIWIKGEQIGYFATSANDHLCIRAIP